ncbi:MAG: 5-carboxymethyl-2-hydroxymuconate isomerase [Pseudomonadota bacterium]
MPHLVADYSANLAERFDMGRVLDQLYEAALETGIFPLGGVRIRLIPVDAYAIADRHDRNAYFSLVLRIGAGRSASAKRAAAALIFERLLTLFVDELAAGHFMLSVDLMENDPDVSFKANGVHGRLSSTE